MKLTRLQEYVFYKYWICRVRRWDDYQFGIRSNLFKNPMKK